MIVFSTFGGTWFISQQTGKIGVELVVDGTGEVL
jgi:hypothetical protein